MKSLLTKVFAGLILPVAAFAAIAKDPNVTPPTASARVFPYVVETMNPDGSKDKELRGISGSDSYFEVVQDLGGKPYPEDKFAAFPDISLQIGGKITLYRAPEIIIVDGKRSATYRSWAKTVGEFLKEKSIEIGQDDKVDYSMNMDTESGMKITIVRVAITQIKENKPIDFKIIKKEDKNLDQGKTRTEKKGEKGEKVLTYELRREDGVEVSRKLIKTEITRPAVDEITIIGTKPAITGWCKYNDLVLDASIKNNLDPNKLCALMKKESFGRPNASNNGNYLGLFQYEPGFWADASRKAGYAGADIFDAKAQIYTTAWALTHGYAGRW